MRQLLRQLVRDDHGMIISSEIVIVGTVLVLGTIVGLASLSHAVTHELNDVAAACDSSYSPSTNPGKYTITDSPGVPEIAGSAY